MEVVKVGFAGRTGRMQSGAGKSLRFVSAFATTNAQKCRFANYANLTLACLYSLHAIFFLCRIEYSPSLPCYNPPPPSTVVVYFYQYTKFLSLVAGDFWESFKHCSNVAEKFCVKWVLSASVWGTGIHSAHTVTHLTSGSDPRNANFSATLRTLKNSHRFPVTPW